MLRRAHAAYTLTPPRVPSQNFCYGTTHDDLRNNPLCNREYANYRSRRNERAYVSPNHDEISFFDEQGYTEARAAPRAAAPAGTALLLPSAQPSRL